jgi:lipopolysaccharide transport system permease protein
VIGRALRYRYLFSQLLRRELRQKYQGSALGVAWYLINPLVLMAVYGVMLGPLLKAVSYPDYPVFILCGLLVWIFFSGALLGATGSLVGQSGLVSSVRFPREAIPAAATAVQLVPLLAMLVVLAPVSLVLRSSLGPALVLLPVLILTLFCLALGLALVTSVLQAYFRDVEPILGAALLPWFFISGVLFRLTKLPGLNGHAHWLEPLLRWVNPVAPYIDAMRDVLYDGRFPSAATILYVVGAALLSLAVGLAVFRRMQGELAVVL